MITLIALHSVQPLSQGRCGPRAFNATAGANAGMTELKNSCWHCQLGWATGSPKWFCCPKCEREYKAAMPLEAPLILKEEKPRVSYRSTKR